MKQKDCRPHWCGDSMQSVNVRVGVLHICILYCADCMNFHDNGYLKAEAITSGVSVISSERAERKAIKAWNKRYYQGE